MHDATPIVFVLDDDSSLCRSLEGLIQYGGLRHATFGCAREFLLWPRTSAPCCLVLDVSLPDVDGLELQARLAVERPEMPVIFITNCPDVPTTVRAMKAGAVEFLTKPFDHRDLLKALRHAVERSRTTIAHRAALQALHERHGLLTPREKEVMALVVSGRLNKQVACDLGISEITVKAHRGRVMRKMQADSFARLIGMAASLAPTCTPRAAARPTVLQSLPTGWQKNLHEEGGRQAAFSL